jgi:hypothetical protein
VLNIDHVYAAVLAAGPKLIQIMIDCRLVIVTYAAIIIAFLVVLPVYMAVLIIVTAVIAVTIVLITVIVAVVVANDVDRFVVIIRG